MNLIHILKVVYKNFLDFLLNLNDKKNHGRLP